MSSDVAAAASNARAVTPISMGSEMQQALRTPLSLSAAAFTLQVAGEQGVIAVGTLCAVVSALVVYRVGRTEEELVNLGDCAGRSESGEFYVW